MVSEGHGGGVLFPQVNIIIKEKYRVKELKTKQEKNEKLRPKHPRK
jgi:hypothetical protein